MMNVMARLALTIMLILQLVGCLDHPKDNNGQTKLKSLEPQEKVAIKVLYPNKNTFFNNYGNYFNSKYPNVEFDVVPTQSIVSTQEIRQLIETENPDVLFLPTEQYEAFSNENMLMNLENLIKQSEFDIQNIHPSVLETIKGKSGGTLFGLTPSFNNHALFYNKDLFEQYGVPFPKNKMTWDEVLDLAERFPTEGQGNNRIYGFAFGTNTSIISVLNEIAGTLGLGLADSDLTKITFQTNGWKQAIELLVRAMNSKAFYKSSDLSPGGLSGNMNDFLTSNLFVSKHAAMTIDNYF